jgi:hypothetical protein
MQNSIGVDSVMVPRNQERHGGEEGEQHRAGGVHVVRPHTHRQSADRQGGGDHALVAENRLLGHRREDLGDDTEVGEGEDVHLGVAEEPEQVLPQQRLAATVRVVEVGAEVAVEPQHGHRRGQHREGQQHQEHRDQLVPAEDWHPEHDHAWGAQTEDRRDGVDRGEDAGETGQADADDPHVGARPGGVDGLGERRVAEPAEVGGAVVGQEAEQEDQEAAQVQPVGEVVEAGEGHVRRADLERDDVVRQAEGEGAEEDEQHDRAVHREQLVERVEGDEVVVRHG